MEKRARIEERAECKKCGNEAILIKVLSTKEKPKIQKREEGENWIYLKDVLILVYECQNCGSKFEIKRNLS